jgi:hypothetical protein
VALKLLKLLDARNHDTNNVTVGNSVGESGQLSRYSDWLKAGRFGDRIPVGARFSAPVRTGFGAHPATYTMGTGSFPRGKSAGAWCSPPTSILRRG